MTATPPPSPGPDRISPEVVTELRERLTKGDDVVDPKTWAGSIPAAFGIAPRLRIGANRWFNVAWLLPIGWGLLLLAVAAAQHLRSMAAVEAFVHRHPGTGFATTFAAPMPVWLRALHFLNLFFLIFIVRAGVQILADHPRLYWTRHSTPGKEWLRMQKEVPPIPLWTAKQDSRYLSPWIGLPGYRHTIGMARHWHFLSVPFWVGNGLVFVALLFATDQWKRLVPSSWQIVPDAWAVFVHYATFHLPPEPNGFYRYNALHNSRHDHASYDEMRCFAD